MSVRIVRNYPKVSGLNASRPSESVRGVLRDPGHSDAEAFRTGVRS